MVTSGARRAGFAGNDMLNMLLRLSYGSLDPSRYRAKTNTRMADANPTSEPRFKSISLANALIGLPSLAAISRNASQNSGSNVTLVRCPLRVRECFCGPRLTVHPKCAVTGQASQSARKQSEDAPRPLRLHEYTGAPGAKRAPGCDSQVYCPSYRSHYIL